MKLWVGSLELNRPMGAVMAPPGFDGSRLLVRVEGVPLGWIDLQAKGKPEGYTHEEILAIVARQFHEALAREAFCREFLPEAELEPKREPISVIICTRDRAQYLDACLQRLQSLDYADFEIIVVDNASHDTQTRDVARKYQARYVWEPRPGLDWARNRGVAEASHSLVAFVDDDARADDQWLKAINRAFGDPEVMGVTGFVAPQELETEAQTYFEYIYGGMGKGFEAASYHRDSLTDQELLWASGFGVGANMAFRRSVFAAIGFFDTALDVGTATRGGGDVEFFHRLVAKGMLLRYEPRAIVWHVHRRDFSALEKQLKSNGCCVIPYLATCLRNRTVSFKAALSYFCFQTVGWWMLGRAIRPRGHRRSLVWAEASGLLLGVTAYGKARAEAARLAKLSPAEGREATLGEKSTGPGAPPLASAEPAQNHPETPGSQKHLLDAKPPPQITNDQASPPDVSPPTQVLPFDSSISCIIPISPDPAGVEETIDSLRQQSWVKWWGFVVLESESSPEVQAKIEKFIAADPRFTLIQGHFGNRARRINAGLAPVKSAWVFVLQPGDRLDKNFLGKSLGVLELDWHWDAVWCQTATRPVGTHFVRTSRPFEATGDLFSLFARQPYFPLSCCVFRRLLTDYAGEFDPSFEFFEGWDFLQRISRAGASFAVVSEPLAFPVSFTFGPDFDRLQNEGMQIIRRGLEMDDRVKFPDPLYRHGLQPGNLTAAEMSFRGFLDGLRLARGMPVTLMLDFVESQIEVSPMELAEDVCLGLLAGISSEETAGSDWWSNYLAIFARVADGLEQKSAVPLLAYRLKHAFEKLLLLACPGNSGFVGHWLKTTVQLEGGINDLCCGPEIHNILFQLEFGAARVGLLELPVIAGRLTAYIIEDAVADRFSWEILRIFFRAGLYNSLTVRDLGEGGCTVFRGDLVLAERLGDPDRNGSEFHDKIGWILFLQELWGEPHWGEEDFYSTTDAPPDDGSDSAVSPFAEARCLQLADDVTNLEHVPPQVAVIVFLGATPLGSIVLKSNQGQISRRTLVSRITNHFGYELCRAAVREGLLAHPVNAPGSLRQRLNFQASRFNLGKQALAAVADVAKHTGEDYVKNVLYVRYPAVRGQSFLPRRNPGLAGLSTSRRSFLPFAPEMETKPSGESELELTDNLAISRLDRPQLAYAPEIFDASRSLIPPEFRARPVPEIVDRGRAILFETLFQTRRDPWGYAVPYEVGKREQILEMIPQRAYARALELACAEGHFTLLLAPRVGQLVAADISVTALQRAAVHCADQKNIEFRQLDLAKDPFGGPYDLVVCNEALYYLGDEATLRQTLEKIASALSPEGLFVTAHSNLVVDDPQKPGFDWDLPFGGRRIGEVILDRTPLRLTREISTPFYRIQCFERKRSWLGRRQPAPEITVMNQPVPLPPSVQRHALWKGGKPRREIAYRGNASPGLPILAYHQVSDSGSPALSQYRVPPSLFEEQLRCLKEAGFYSVTLHEWCLAVAARQSLPGRPCVISFDDGYRDFATDAWPLLKKFGFSATVFLVTGQVGKDNAWDARFGGPAPLMSWSEVASHAAEGVEFGTHSVSHWPMTGLDPGGIFREMYQSKNRLEQKLGAVTSFAYPYGDWDPSTRHIVGACGYLCALTCNSGFAQMQSDLLALPRIMVGGDDNLNRFTGKLGL